MPPKKSKRPRPGREATNLDRQLVKALNHPLRVRILAALNERCASPVELSEVIDAELSSISYHTKVLLSLGCVAVVQREVVRGAVKTTYRATRRMLLDRPEWESLSPEVRTGISAAALNEVMDRAADALERGTFDSRTERAVITLKMDLDDSGWTEVTDIVTDAYERLCKVEAQAANRTSADGGRFRTTVSLLAYESPTFEPADPYGG